MGSDLVDLTDDALVHRLLGEERTLVRLRFRHSRGQLENTSKLKVSRREIARLATEVRKRELASGQGKGTMVARHHRSFVPDRQNVSEPRKGSFLSSVVDKLGASE